VRSFLVSSALFWLDKYHIDGLRIDAVASMIYLDYSRKAGEWIPNKYGGRENLEAISFLKELNEEVYRSHPDVQTIAEESTAWPKVSKPVHIGGLGFGMKWNMGWMHDTLKYFCKDHIYRKHHQNELTFSFLYAFTENFVLSLSHDEVVHGKGSLVNKMHGNEWQKFANLRLLFGYMYAHPGKKLLFMGCEFGQWKEWNHDLSLDWQALEYHTHQSVQKWVCDLNHYYRNTPLLYENDFRSDSFEWIDFNDYQQSVISFIRKGDSPDDVILVVCNFTPVPRYNYRIGVPVSGFWKEVLNSDAGKYGGSGLCNRDGVESDRVHIHGRNNSISITLPPLGIVFLRPENKNE
jgi:1,4-alpha-glucan branching enzyme